MDAVLNRLGLVQGMEDENIKIALQKLALLPLLESTLAVSKAPDRLLLHCDAGIKIESDPQLLKIMVANLVDNAIKYGDPKAMIEVRVQPSANIGFVDLMVTNLPGKAGVPDASMVFQKYYRASWAHEKMGSGLGLYLIKQFSLMLDAELSYVPTPNKVTFNICLKQLT
jgi:signal transduction histidine kinase